MILNDIPKGITLKEIPEAIFISSSGENSISGIDDLKEELKRLGCDYPIPTYMSSECLKIVSMSFLDITHLDVTTISPGIETPIGDGYVKVGGSEDSMTFNFENSFDLSFQAFGSVGGKAAICKSIVDMIPQHEKYVEPYAGGAAVFFSKEKSSKEILNDMNKSIVNSYKFLRDASTEDLSKACELVKKNPDKDEFFRMRDEVDKGVDPSIEGFVSFYRLTYYSFGYNRKDYGYVTRTPGMNIGKMERIKERLSGVDIRNDDAASIILDEDSPSTFFYLDPPYPENWGGKESFGKYTFEKFEELLKICGQMKGKFILSINDSEEVRKRIPKQLNVKEIETRRSLDRRHDGSKTKDNELLVSNFKIDDVDEAKEEKWKKWNSLVNMSESELKSFMESEEGKKAGLTKDEADKQGIKSGRESAEWLLKMIPSGRSFESAKKNWNDSMWEWCGRQISFISRMKGNDGPLYESDGKTKTRKHLSLLIWGHNPKKGNKDLSFDLSDEIMTTEVFLRLQSIRGKWMPYVVQHHYKDNKIHTDIRIQCDDGKLVEFSPFTPGNSTSLDKLSNESKLTMVGAWRADINQEEFIDVDGSYPSNGSVYVIVDKGKARVHSVSDDEVIVQFNGSKEQVDKSEIIKNNLRQNTPDYFKNLKGYWKFFTIGGTSYLRKVMNEDALRMQSKWINELSLKTIIPREKISAISDYYRDNEITYTSRLSSQLVLSPKTVYKFKDLLGW